jgi:hypothetical protein
MLEVNTQTATMDDIEEFLTSAVLCFADDASKKVPCKINSEDWVIQFHKSVITGDLMYFFTKGTVQMVERAIENFNSDQEMRYSEQKLSNYDRYFTHIRANGSTLRGSGATMTFSQAVVALSLYQ